MDEREQQPDREGYLAFRQQYEQTGKVPFEVMPQWCRPREQHGPLAQYFEVLTAQEHLARLHAEPADAVLRDLQKYMPELRDGSMGPAVLKQVKQILRGWEEERARSYVDYLHLQKDFDRQVTQRQKEHPAETPGQAWFKVRAKMECGCRERLHEQRLATRDALMRARRERAVPQLGDRGYAKSREPRAARNRDRGGRER